MSQRRLLLLCAGLLLLASCVRGDDNSTKGHTRDSAPCSTLPAWRWSCAAKASHGSPFPRHVEPGVSACALLGKTVLHWPAYEGSLVVVIQRLLDAGTLQPPRGFPHARVNRRLDLRGSVFVGDAPFASRRISAQLRSCVLPAPHKHVQDDWARGLRPLLAQLSRCSPSLEALSLAGPVKLQHFLPSLSALPRLRRLETRECEWMQPMLWPSQFVSQTGEPLLPGLSSLVIGDDVSHPIASRERPRKQELQLFRSSQCRLLTAYSRQLRRLHLHMLGLDAALLSALFRLTMLEVLLLRAIELMASTTPAASAAEAAALSSWLRFTAPVLPRLRSLTIVSLPWTDELRRLLLPSCPALAHLHLQQAQVTAQSLRTLSLSNRGLLSLAVTDCPLLRLDRSSLSLLLRSAATLPQLRVFHFCLTEVAPEQERWRLDAAALLQLLSASPLERLLVRLPAALTAAELAVLCRLPRLRVIGEVPPLALPVSLHSALLRHSRRQRRVGQGRAMAQTCQAARGFRAGRRRRRAPGRGRRRRVAGQQREDG